MDFPINRFKHAILNGQKQIGLWSHLCSPISIEILAHCGYDWLLLDMEHSPNEVPDVLAQLQAMQGGTATPIVRPPWNDMVTFKRLLDIGVQTLLVPYIQTAEEARNAVSYTRYPPQGVRGVSVSQRSNRYGTVPDYFKNVNQHMCVMVQIESLAGVAAVKEIAAVDGVDCIFVGPSDLAAALGHLGNAGHPEVQAVIAQIFADAKAAGKPTGILAPLEAHARKYLEMGATFVGVGSDLGAFRSATQALCERYRD